MFIFVLSNSSCQYPVALLYDHLPDPLLKYDDSLPDRIPEFKTIKEALHWVHTNIEYQQDKDDDVYSEEDWKIPKRTLADGYGDCEDMAALLIAIVRKQFAIEMELCILKPKEEGKPYHASPRYKDFYYDPTSDDTYPFPDGYHTYNYYMTLPWNYYILLADNFDFY